MRQINSNRAKAVLGKTFDEQLDWGGKKLECFHKHSWIAGASLFSLEKYSQLAQNMQYTLYIYIYICILSKHRHTHHI